MEELSKGTAVGTRTLRGSRRGLSAELRLTPIVGMYLLGQLPEDRHAGGPRGSTSNDSEIRFEVDEGKAEGYLLKREAGKVRSSGHKSPSSLKTRRGERSNRLCRRLERDWSRYWVEELSQPPKPSMVGR